MSIHIPQHAYPARRVSWTKRDVLLFAASIGCSAEQLHFLYELHPNFQAFPTYPIVLTFKYAHPSTIDFLSSNAATALPPPAPAFDWANAVDGHRRITIYRPLPTSSDEGQFEMRSKVLGVYDKGPGKGTVLEKEHTLVDEHGEVYSRAWESAVFVGTGGWGGERGPSITKLPPPPRAPDLITTCQTTKETAHLYRLNGDYNPLHATPEPGQALGYGGIILHGLFSWNVAAVTVLRHFGGSQGERFVDFEARFVRPVRPGDRLEVRMWEVGVFGGRIEGVYGRLKEVRFEVCVEGRVVLGDGRALLRMGEARL